VLAVAATLAGTVWTVANRLSRRKIEAGVEAERGEEFEVRDDGSSTSEGESAAEA
jgi:hypothetical protein